MQLCLTFGTAMRDTLIHISPKVLAKRVCSIVKPFKKLLLHLKNSAIYLKVFFPSLLAVWNTYLLWYMSITALAS